MITAMTTFLLITVLVVLFASLVSYARHDHFGGPANATQSVDDLGPVEVRRHLVPRH